MHLLKEAVGTGSTMLMAPLNNLATRVWGAAKTSRRPAVHLALVFVPFCLFLASGRTSDKPAEEQLLIACRSFMSRV